MIAGVQVVYRPKRIRWVAGSLAVAAIPATHRIRLGR